MATKTKRTSKKTKKTAAKAISISRLGKVTSKITVKSLHKWNIYLAVIFAIQAIAILILGNSTTVPIVTHYLAPDTLASQVAGQQVSALAVRHIVDIKLTYLVAAFLLISAIMHTIIATKRRRNYEQGLTVGTNELRWMDYALSAGVMLVTIGLLNGVYDVSTLLTIFVLIVILHLLGYLGELSDKPRAKWHSFLGLLTCGGVAWLVIAAYVKGALLYGNGLPHYVYWIDATIFIITLGLAFNTLKVFKAKGKWSNYLYGEQMFMVLGLIAKTALAWQIFFGILR